MKIRIAIVLVCTMILILSACVKIGENKLDQKDENMSKIESLEQMVRLLASEHQKENNENRVEIEKLKAEIELLKREEETKNSESLSENTDNVSKFLYEIKDGEAVITGYTGSDTYIVIPSHIDGYTVSSIGESAFSMSKISSVVVSEGVKRIDWFAFYTCPTLKSITLPSSVTYIGYAAFDGASSSFSIYCPHMSYASQYAKSYAIPCVEV